MSKNSYRYKTEPYAHQELIFEASRDREAFALFLDMGVGKSKIIIDTAAYLYSQGKINSMLVVAPKGVYANWVVDQIPVHMPDHVLEQSAILQWRSNYRTRKFQEELAEFFRPEDMKFKIFVINIEALHTFSGIDVCVRFLRAHDTLMVVDESTTIKNPQAKWTQKVIKLGRGAKYRRILTGTPITNSPLDVFSQFEFLDPDILGYSSYYSFRNRYALLRRRRVSSHTFTEVVGYQRLPELRGRMEQAAVFIKKDDCLDLPEKIYVDRDVEFSPKQREIYESLKRLSVAELEGAGVVTVDLALTKLLRLHQICCGFVSVDEESTDDTARYRVEEIDKDGGPRIKELLSVIEEMESNKIIIWANYRYNVQMIKKVLSQTYGHDRVASYAGETIQEDREKIVKNFQDPEHPLRFFVGQSRTGGFGLTLTQAFNVVYFSNDYNLETRLQSEDRAHRIGQTKPVTYVDLRIPNTVDQKIVEVLKKKQNLADQITGSNWKEFLE